MGAREGNKQSLHLACSPAPAPGECFCHSWEEVEQPHPYEDTHLLKRSTRLAGSSPAPRKSLLSASYLHALARMMLELLAGSPVGTLLYPEWAFLSGCCLLPTCSSQIWVDSCSIKHTPGQELNTQTPTFQFASPSLACFVLSPVSCPELFVCICRPS